MRMIILVLWRYYWHSNWFIMMRFLVTLIWNSTAVMKLRKSMYSSSIFTLYHNSACHNFKSITTQMASAVARMRMRILVFWSYCQNTNPFIPIEAQVDSKSVTAPMISVVVTLAAMTWSAMNTFILGRCTIMNPICLRRCGQVNFKSITL